MTALEFRNALCVLMRLDQDELVTRGILESGDLNAWGEFCRDPLRYGKW